MITVSCLLLLEKVLIHHHNFLGKSKQLLDHPVTSYLSVRLNKTSPLILSPSDMYCRFLNILLFFHVILSSFCFSSTGVLLLSVLFPLQPHCHWLKDNNHSPTVQTIALPKQCSLWFVLFAMRAYCCFRFSLATTKTTPEYQHQ